jgi:hypothetical protein
VSRVCCSRSVLFVSEIVWGKISGDSSDPWWEKKINRDAFLMCHGRKTDGQQK